MEAEENLMSKYVGDC